MSRFKERVLSALTSSAVARACVRLNRDVAPVFMLHRFDREGRRGFLSVHLLRHALRFFRREGLEVVTLETLSQRIDQGVRAPMVVLTVDDGYADFHDIAAPALLEYEASATVFLTTGFLDGNHWQWWDRLEWSFEHSDRTHLEIPIAGERCRLSWSKSSGWQPALDSLVRALKRVQNDERLSALELAFDGLGVTPPKEVPAVYRPMSWENVRALQARGIEFSPHSVSHPVLSRLSDDRAREEIVESTERCTAELGRRPKTFCYPDGTDEAFSEREVEILRELDFDCAVSAKPGYVSLRGNNDRYRLRRFSFPETLDGVIQIASGLERLKRIVRRES